MGRKTCRRAPMVVSCAVWALLAVALLPPPGQAAPARRLVIAAGPPPLQDLLAPAEADFERATGIELELVKKEPASGFVLDLESGAADGVVTGLDVAGWLEALEAKGLKLTSPPDQLKQRVVGRDVVHVITHPAVGVTALTRSQLAAIFTGRTRDWREVGGRPGAIRIALADRTPGINSSFQKLMMDGQPYGGNLEYVGTQADVVAHVAATPLSVGFAPSTLVASQVSNQVRRITTPEIGRPYYLVTLGRPRAELEELVSFLKRRTPGSQP